MVAGDDNEIERMLRTARTIAVVGLSDRPDRPSFGVAQYLSRWYEIVPINPQLQVWQGRKAYPDIASVPVEIVIDIVDVFRRSEQVMPVVEEAVARGVPHIVLQQGIRNEAAARLARQHGIHFLEDVCLAVLRAQVDG